jgi:hypothetical protein
MTGKFSKRLVFLTLLATLILLLMVFAPASAITDGELDGDDHPHVVLLLMEVGGEPMYRCSGTLLSPTVLLTAGHCTSNYPDEPFSGMRVFTESDVDGGDNSYPYAGNNTVEAVDWYAHPLFETEDPFYMHDVGIVILEEPGVVGLTEYGALPELDEFDDLPMPSGKANKTWFTSVGYGQQIIFTDDAQWEMQSERIRMVAHPFLKQLNVPGITGDYSLWLSNNHATGGTCYGDSGGPNFLGDSNIVAGVTSFGMNETCSGSGGVFRTDRADVLEFIRQYFP